MPTEIETVIAGIRAKHEAARQAAEFYARMLREVEAAAGSLSGGAKLRRGKAVGAAGPAPAQPERHRPAKAVVSASEAILRLLAGCKMGLPVSEILEYASTTYGFRRNSLRTTVYNLKKQGAIVQGEDGTYNHPDNLG